MTLLLYRNGCKNATVIKKYLTTEPGVCKLEEKECSQCQRQ